MATESHCPNADCLDKFYRTCHTLFGRLIKWVPEFYSDWGLVHFCTTQVWEKDVFRPHSPLFYPNIVPTQETQDAVAKAACLELSHWDCPTMGETVETALRGILETLPGNSQATSRETLIKRLSFVKTRILVFPPKQWPQLCHR